MNSDSSTKDSAEAEGKQSDPAPEGSSETPEESPAKTNSAADSKSSAEAEISSKTTEEKPALDERSKDEPKVENKNEPDKSEKSEDEKDKPASKSDSENKDSEKDAKAGKPEAEKPLVVLIDDDVDFVGKVREHFEAKEIDIQTYTSKSELESGSLKRQPSLLIIDVDVSGDDGRSIALDLKDAGKLGNAIIILLVDTDLDKATVEFTLKLGFRKVIRKPVAPGVLERILLDEPRQKAAAAAHKKTVVVAASESETKDAEKPDENPADQAIEEAPADEKDDGESAGKKANYPKTSAIAQAMSTAMSMKPVKGAGDAPVRAADPVVSQSPKPAAPKKAPPKLHREEKVASDPGGGSLGKGMVFGIVFAFVTAALLGILVSSGYAHSFMIGEGVLIGLAAGIGLLMGWKKAELFPSAVTIAVALASFSGWLVLLIIRAATGVPFVERTAAMIQFAKEHPEIPPTWGTSESTAVGFIIGQLIVTFIVTMFLAKMRSTKPTI